jgi:hypothetical protein
MPRHMESTKVVALIQPQAIVDNDDPVGAYGDDNPLSVDTLGYGKCDIYVQIGATDIAMTALAAYHGTAAASGADDTDYAVVTGGAFSGSTGASRLPQADDDNTFFHIGLDLDGLDRYIALDATCGNGSAGTFISAFAVLSEPDVHPNTATERGIAGELYA